MNWEGFGRKLSWPTRGTMSGVTEENPKNLDHDSQFRSRDLNGDLTYNSWGSRPGEPILFCSSYTFSSPSVSQQSKRCSCVRIYTRASVSDTPLDVFSFNLPIA
jgi:hypothetical protein